MAKRSHLRITTWPGGRLPTPAVNVRPDVRVDGEFLFFGGDVNLPRPSYSVPPEDMYLYEFADLDLADVEAVADLCRRCGAIAFPLLDNDLPLSEVALARAMHEQAERYGRSYRATGEDGVPFNGLGIHVDTFTYRVRIVRALTAHVLAFRDGKPTASTWPDCADEHEAWGRFEWLANGALAPFHVRVEIDLGNPDFDMGVPRPSLYSVAVLQLVNDLGADAAYKTCAAETCGRRFVHQRGRSLHYNRSTGVAYCSPSCANAQAQREWRRRQRENKKGDAR